MKLGDHTIGLRNLLPRLDGNGQPVLDEYDQPIVDAVDIKVRWCSMTPSSRLSDTNEPGDRVEPALTGMTLIAPPETPVTDSSIIVWPITDEATVDGQLRLTGTEWQVLGEPGLWDESVEARLRKAT